MRVQNKVAKQKDTLYRVPAEFPTFHFMLGGNRKLANSIAWLKQPLDENSQHQVKYRRDSKGKLSPGGLVCVIRRKRNITYQSFVRICVYARFFFFLANKLASNAKKLPWKFNSKTHLKIGATYYKKRLFSP